MQMLRVASSKRISYAFAICYQVAVWLIAHEDVHIPWALQRKQSHNTDFHERLYVNIQTPTASTDVMAVQSHTQG